MTCGASLDELRPGLTQEVGIWRLVGFGMIPLIAAEASDSP